MTKKPVPKPYKSIRYILSILKMILGLVLLLVEIIKKLKGF